MQTNRKLNTVECRYKAVQYNRISQKALQQLRQNIHRISYSQKLLHMSPWGVCCEDFGEKWQSYNGTGHHNSSLGTTLQWRHNVCSAFCSCRNQREHQSSASLAFVRGIHRWPVNSPRKRPVTRKMFPFDDVIMSKKLPGATIHAVLGCPNTKMKITISFNTLMYYCNWSALV